MGRAHVGTQMLHGKGTRRYTDVTWEGHTQVHRCYMGRAHAGTHSSHMGRAHVGTHRCYMVRAHVDTQMLHGKGTRRYTDVTW